MGDDPAALLEMLRARGLDVWVEGGQPRLAPRRLAEDLPPEVWAALRSAREALAAPLAVEPLPRSRWSEGDRWFVEDYPGAEWPAGLPDVSGSYCRLDTKE
jgi:hypothetical protein